MRSIAYTTRIARTLAFIMLAQPFAVRASVTIDPDWGTLNTVQKSGGAKAAWDIWWGAGDYQKACYMLASNPLGCVNKTSGDAGVPTADANGNILAGSAGVAFKGLFNIPANKFPSTAEAEMKVQLLNASGNVLDEGAFTMKFEVASNGGGGEDGGSFVVPITALDAKEAELTSGPKLQTILKSIAARHNAVVAAVMPGAASNPDNVKRAEGIITPDVWEYLFSARAPEYSYRGFLQAVAKFPSVCATYADGRDSQAICRKVLATMFAHFAQETGEHNVHSSVPEWRQGLHWVREVGWTEASTGGYNGECNPAVWQGKAWPCGILPNGEFKSYFGRGAKQLSYNYNYGPFSEAMYGSVRPLLDNPERVADTWLNLASALFFFTYPQTPKPSMLHVADGTWQPNSRDLANGLVPGFGVTTQIINGGVECGGTEEVAQSLNRIKYYQALANYLSVPIAEDEVLGCKNMKSFDEAGSGAQSVFWEQDYSYDGANPGGKSYACKLVSYQTPYSAFSRGHYANCVQNFFPDMQIDYSNDTVVTEKKTFVTENYAANLSSGTVYYLVNGQDAARGPTKGIWSGASGYSVIKARVNDTVSGQPFDVVLRGSRSSSCYNHKMEDGVICYSAKAGPLTVSFSRTDNLSLPVGNYSGAFVVEAKGWHVPFSQRVPVKIRLAVAGYDGEVGATTPLVTENYALSAARGTVYYVVPQQANASGPTNGIWSGASGHSPITVKVKNRATGDVVDVVLRGSRTSSCYNHKMQDGVICYSARQGALTIRYVAQDNPGLAAGAYDGAVLIQAKGWHDTAYQKELYVKVTLEL